MWYRSVLRMQKQMVVMACLEIIRKYKAATCLWPIITRQISSSPVLQLMSIREDKKFERTKLKGKNKLPPPHTPVTYPTDWRYPKHKLTTEYMENYEPPKLLMVRRIAPLGGRFVWEKYILTQLRIHENTEDVAVVKNTPTMNLKLYKIKHLIEVKPITFPNGLPEPGDYTGTYLKPNGEFIVNKKLKVDQEKLKLPEDYARKRLDDQYLRDHLRHKWEQKINFL